VGHGCRSKAPPELAGRGRMGGALQWLNAQMTNVVAAG
jgi:hypothetical protein